MPFRMGLYPDILARLPGIGVKDNVRYSLLQYQIQVINDIGRKFQLLTDSIDERFKFGNLRNIILKQQFGLYFFQKDIEQLDLEYSTGTQKINQVQEELDTARKELKGMKTDIHINEAKEAAAKAGKTVFNAVTSIFNVGEVKRQAKEIETLKKEKMIIRILSVKF